MNRARFRRTPYSASGFVAASPIFLDHGDGQGAPLGQPPGLCRHQRARLPAQEFGERPGAEGVEPGVFDQRHGHLAVVGEGARARW
ncbi:hypothetical protein ASD51_24875 [Streptomyces sp. Root55]|nr:hypothetical protein ASD26_23345 [Streptomyces sp. Root1319]KQZ20050.1 hypothetical protein ASD51_24875 [Streptomyces sp. Root55]